MRSSNGDNTTEKNRALVAAVMAGKPDAIAHFIREISGTIWASCRALSAYEGEARDNFIDVMAQLRASGFAAFRDYDGRSTLKTFTALVVRELYCRKVLQLFDSDPAKAWRIFAQLFEADIRLINRRLPATASEDNRQDLYQSICVALMDQNYRRLRAYSGKGSFSGFVLRCADNIVRDEIRSGFAPRRRLPVPVARLGELEREVFRLVFWNSVPDRTDLLAQHLHSRFSRDFPSTEIELALTLVRKVAKSLRVSAPPQGIDDSAEPSPEDILIQAREDEQLSAALGALTQAIQILPDDERLYLMLMLRDSPPPPRDLARIMQRPVEDIYAMKQRVLKKLRELICENAAVKNWLTSV